MFEKGKIGIRGDLQYWRKGRFVEAWCIYNDCHCGSHCSHFEEPLTQPTFTALGLCKKTLQFKEFIDERK